MPRHKREAQRAAAAFCNGRHLQSLSQGEQDGLPKLTPTCTERGVVTLVRLGVCVASLPIVDEACRF